MTRALPSVQRKVTDVDVTQARKRWRIRDELTEARPRGTAMSCGGSSRPTLTLAIAASVDVTDARWLDFHRSKKSVV